MVKTKITKRILAFLLVILTVFTSVPLIKTQAAGSGAISMLSFKKNIYIVIWNIGSC